MELNFDIGEIANKIIVDVMMFSLTTVVSFFVGRWWGVYKARKQWESRHFFAKIIAMLMGFSF